MTGKGGEMKTYSAWTRNKNENQEVLTELKCKSVKEFRNVMENKNRIVASRVTIKKGLRHPLPK
jgi:hypothetical protein